MKYPLMTFFGSFLGMATGWGILWSMGYLSVETMVPLSVGTLLGWWLYHFQLWRERR